mmetsp:Transcript_40842/g.128236  ORF Transcript_40842/g.128236 Transcript_40842/m.128236 type:complete len:218 (+) Transcript_40842:513-1166(+)
MLAPRADGGRRAAAPRRRRCGHIGSGPVSDKARARPPIRGDAGPRPRPGGRGAAQARRWTRLRRGRRGERHRRGARGGLCAARRGRDARLFVRPPDGAGPAADAGLLREERAPVLWHEAGGGTAASSPPPSRVPLLAGGVTGACPSPHRRLFPTALKLLRAKRFPVRDMVTHRYSIDEAQVAYEVAADEAGDACAVFLYPSGQAREGAARALYSSLD